MCDCGTGNKGKTLWEQWLSLLGGTLGSRSTEGYTGGELGCVDDCDEERYSWGGYNL
jgi:hypothetical protein